MNNTFCKNCHRIPSQCCCAPAKTLTDDAYELADELLAGGEWSMRAQAMLRYQADYIKRLEEGLESSIALNKAQAERAQKK